MSDDVSPPTPDLLAGRVGLVTGAGRGLGEAVALSVAAAGATVVINDISGVAAAATVDNIETAGGTALAVVGDVSDESDVAAMVTAATERFGRLDFACNNAVPAIGMEPVESIDMANAERLIQVALVGTALCCKHEIRAMAAQGGSIVNVSSTAHLRGQAGTGVYAACKAGIEALTRVAANENGGRGIRVNAVQAGAMLTPALAPMLDAAPGVREMIEAGIPLGRVAAPAEVADVVRFLVSDLARFVTAAVLTADGGGLLQGSAVRESDV